MPGKLVNNNDDDNLNNPELFMKQQIDNMEESLQNLTIATANAVANELTLKTKYENIIKNVNVWQENAEKCMQINREDLAKSAIERKHIYVSSATELKVILDSAQSISQKLRTQLSSLKTKIDETKSKRNSLIARASAAKIQVELAKSLNDVHVTDALSTFEENVDSLEDQVYAHKLITEDCHDVALAIDNLNVSVDIENDYKLLENKYKSHKELDIENTNS